MVESLDQPLDRIYSEGMAAFRSDVPQADCPYPETESRSRFDAWRGGWAEAKLIAISEPRDHFGPWISVESEIVS